MAKFPRELRCTITLLISIGPWWEDCDHYVKWKPFVYMAAGIFHKKCGMSAAFVRACVNRALNVRSCFRFCAGRGSWGVSTGCQRLFMRGFRFLSSVYSSSRPLAENLSAYGRYRKEHPPAGIFALPKSPKRTLNHRSWASAWGFGLSNICPLQIVELTKSPIEGRHANYISHA